VVSADTHALPSVRNRACGTNGIGECVGDMACVDILEKRSICYRSSSPKPSHCADCAVLHGLEDEMKTIINKMRQEFQI
jgi:hypothetical protein